MIDLVAVRTRLGVLHCPVCKKSSDFSVHPRGQEGYTEIIHTVRCNQCAYTFPISILTKPPQLTDPDTAEWLKRLGCPDCHELGARLDFRCRLTVRESVAFVTCLACHRAYHERTPMEAYE